MPALDKHDTPLPTTTVKWRFPSIHPEGRKYAVGVGAVALLVYWGASHFIGWLLIGLTIWVATFFRDPIRTTPRGDKFIVAPADGLITMIAKVPPPPELRGTDGLEDGDYNQDGKGEHCEDGKAGHPGAVAVIFIGFAIKTKAGAIDGEEHEEGP